ncbi:uncharacterized protein LOC125433861 [Sphaerodactylus townsendi]|uniref:uncharacterized protein LOC125433861 n=1 Tax=Sphaerodactylus townsendi TaxID=933632 RepID=UPI0020265BDD|nr:uncharacterized protein LOC125433861 [Sphaerodactylus townsendi]
MRGGQSWRPSWISQVPDKVTQFHLNCKQRLALWRAGENEPWSTEALHELESSLQPPSEFSPEKFQQMKMQASSMRSRKGLEVWREASEKCEEAKQVLEDVQAKWRKSQEGRVRVCGGKWDPLGTGPDPPAETLDEDPYFDGVLVKTRNQGCPLEYNKRSLDTDRTGTQEHPSCGESKDQLGREGAYLVSLLAVPESGSSGGENPNKESSESLLAPTQTPPPPVLHAHPSCLKPKHVPETCEDLPSTDWTCVTVPVRGQRRRRKEAAQYFQLSRHGSFSSEDTDSQNSTEDSLGCSAALSVESVGSKGASSQEKALGIVYLENHSATSLHKATSQ